MALALLGGVVGLDAASCPQVMISRPVVAGPLAGLLLGSPATGLWIGALLEILTLRQLPVGASRYWDTGPAAVAATAAAAGFAGAGGAVGAVGAGGAEARYVLAVALGVLVGWVGSWSVYAMRRANARLVGALGERSVSPRELEIKHLLAMAMDFGRATALTALGVIIAVALAHSVDLSFGSADAAGAILLAVAASLALGADIGTMQKGRPVFVGFFLAAFASGAVLLWLS
ncbi:MAG: PTS sugar transporter subunit IIC [Gemmatimonadota bacterium]|nr:PTS sugar transporter subunit IIC [Candidatus Palauibacterales bacterium]